MNIAVEIFERFAAMANHRTREGGESFFRNFDGAGNEKLVVWDHEANVQRSTLNVQRSMQGDSRRTYESAGETPALPCLFDETDVAAAFDVAGVNILEVLGFRGETKIFFHIMPRDVIAPHRAE